MGMSVVGLQNGLDLVTEMGTLGKGSFTWQSARRGLRLLSIRLCGNDAAFCQITLTSCSLGISGRAVTQ